MNEKDFEEQLVSWYRENKRTLPWRDTNDPYRIWLSEIILQQTRVVQGYDYYIRFIERFPNLQSMASATEEEVLHLWKGLGYYTRARNLYATALYIAQHYNYQFPNTYAEILKLKGIGPYTAAAIASFAFNLPYATVDGNIQRVLSRLFYIEAPINTPWGVKIIQEKATSLLDKSHSSQHNQAMMELGALICLPRSPHCEECPVRKFCTAFQVGKVERLPIKQGKVKVKDRYLNYLRVNCKGETLLVKRTQKDIWQNLYEYVLVETSQKATKEEIQDSAVFNQLIQENSSFELKETIQDFIHQLSHQRLHVSLYELCLENIPFLSFSYQVVKRGEEGQYPISRLMEILVETNELSS